MIYAEQRELLKDDLLETYIENFMQRVSNIKYIEIYDNNFDVIARKDKLNSNSISLDYNSDNFKTNQYKI
jgi:hypothetical protein